MVLSQVGAIGGTADRWGLVAVYAVGTRRCCPAVVSRRGGGLVVLVLDYVDFYCARGFVVGGCECCAYFL